MSPLSLFFDNRRLLTLAISLILVAGLSSFYLLPRMEDPVLTHRAAIVNTIYPGASAEQVDRGVSRKIEKALEGMPGIKKISSFSEPIP